MTISLHEDLWSWMDGLRERGVDTIAIPHNSNGSNGQMFEMENWEGLPISTQYAEFRMRNEPIVEMTQVKGTSETHPILSPNDQWADFEIMDQRVGNSAYSRPFGGYVRQAYLDGLAHQDKLVLHILQRVYCKLNYLLFDPLSQNLPIDHLEIVLDEFLKCL